MTMKNILIQVTEDDIKHGSPRSCKNCPIALAITRHLKEGYLASVGLPSWGIKQDRQYITDSMFLPKEATNFINRYDNGSLMTPHAEPITFNIFIPEEYLTEVE